LHRNIKPINTMPISVNELTPVKETSDTIAPDPQSDTGELKEVERGGPKGLEPTRYGDWERKGRCVDF
jgi:hypothetical protein